MKNTFAILFFLFAQGASAQLINRDFVASEKIILSDCSVNSQLTFNGSLPDNIKLQRARDTDWFTHNRRARVQRRVASVVFTIGLALFTKGFITTLKAQ